MKKLEKKIKILVIKNEKKEEKAKSKLLKCMKDEKIITRWCNDAR